MVRIHQQISRNAREGFNCRQLMSWLDVTLQLASGEHFRRNKLQALSLQLFRQLDQNRDGVICSTDMLSLQPRVLRAFAPTDSSDVEKIQSSAQKRFLSLSRGGTLTYNRIQQLIIAKLPKILPMRQLTAQACALMLLEVSSPHPEQGLRDRSITEEQWISTAIGLAS